MCPQEPAKECTNRILIVDDNTAIHEDFKRILMARGEADDFAADDAAFFGDAPAPKRNKHRFDLEFASQGQEALEKVREAIRNGHRFAVVFMDVRMPPGWDGIETAMHLWKEDPDLQIVICTAYSDYSWDDMVEKLGQTDKLLILRKPFDVIEAEQAAHAFSKKWELLQQSRRHAVFLEQTMDLSPLMIFWISECGQVTYANQAACRHLRKKPEEFDDTKATEIFSTWNENGWRELWNKILPNKNLKQETFINTKDGVAIPVEVIITILDFQESRVMCVTAQDISERLETLRELADARDAALESARMKSQFLANMSHEIRTPMNGVLGMAELLAKTELNSSQKEYVGIINQSGTALLSIINDILDSAKIESGKIEFQHIPFDLHEVARGAIHTISPNATKKQIDLDCHVDPGINQPLYGDPGRLRQVLLNLVSNAVKFTTKGHVVLEIRLLGESENAYQLHFSVKDTGIGINPEQLHRIFQPFTQADNTNKRSYGGTGLGLTISSQIVQAMGGSIQVTSAEGKGSEFWFNLTMPKACDEQITAAPRIRKSSAPATQTNGSTSSPKLRPTGALRILLVEDNEVNRKVTLMQLEQLGYSADVAENGQEALRALDRNAYDVILMDCQMPIMDGYEATREIRRRFRRPIRIIALTANAMKEDRKRCLAAGMDDYLSKPLDSASLAKALAFKKSTPKATEDETAAAPATDDAPDIDDEDLTPAVNLSRLTEITGDNEELLREISQQYLDQAEEILTDMEHAIHSGRHDDVCKLAHKLAGSSATCGMAAIVPSLRTIESLNSSQTTEALGYYQIAVKQLARIRVFLTKPPI